MSRGTAETAYRVGGAWLIPLGGTAPCLYSPTRSCYLLPLRWFCDLERSVLPTMRRRWAPLPDSEIASPHQCLSDLFRPQETRIVPNPQCCLPRKSIPDPDDGTRSTATGVAADRLVEADVIRLDARQRHVGLVAEPLQRQQLALRQAVVLSVVLDRAGCNRALESIHRECRTMIRQ